MPSSRIGFKIESATVARLAAKLADLDRKVCRKALRDGVSQVTQEAVRVAKALVPKRSKRLQKSLGRKVKSYRGGAVITGIVGPRKGFRVLWRGKYIDPAKYAHLVEYGRREVRPKNKKVLADGTAGVGGLPGQGTIYGKRVRSVPPRPFMRPAAQFVSDYAPGILIDHLNAAIRRFVASKR